MQRSLLSWRRLESRSRTTKFLRNQGEVKTSVRGSLPGGWSFFRAWCYWVVDGPGLPPEYSYPLDDQHGREVRANGDCAARGARFWGKGFATSNYHVDTQEGLNALAAALKACFVDHPESKRP